MEPPQQDSFEQPQHGYAKLSSLLPPSDIAHGQPQLQSVADAVLIFRQLEAMADQLPYRQQQPEPRYALSLAQYRATRDRNSLK